MRRGRLTVRRVVASAAVAAVALSLGLFGPVDVSSASTGSAFSATKTVSRDKLQGGVSTVMDKRTVTVSVDTTANLRSRQEIEVSWTGAHPTGGIVSDQNSSDAQHEEYPMVIMECRGTASTVSPSTCWTQSWSERVQISSVSASAFPPWRVDRYAPASRP